MFAAARWLGAQVGPYEGLRRVLLEQWPDVEATVMSRATQTNEVGRCATMLPLLASLPGPLALLEVGCSAGLCLLPDRYSYRYTGSRGAQQIDPAGGPSPVVLDCRLEGDVPLDDLVSGGLPEIVWRGGLDLNPLDVQDDDAMRWLQTLVWPEHDDRRARLAAAVDVARADPPTLVRGDLLVDLPALVAQVPADATLVVFHSAVLAYLSEADRSRFAETMAATRGHWVSNEGPLVVPGIEPPPRPPDSSAVSASTFLLALDQTPGRLDPRPRACGALALGCPPMTSHLGHVDVLIIGAGLSGIGAACHLQDGLPGTSYLILEARATMGGTWDLFRYPGVRSDSDMFTLGYRFRPWTGEKAIADGPSILDYVRETAREYDVEQQIRYGVRVRARRVVQRHGHLDRARHPRRRAGRWSPAASCGRAAATTATTRAISPHFDGVDDFTAAGGTVVHPQHWPADLDYEGKRVIVVGSGATAVTLVPAMAMGEHAASHVTMLQRSPTYILALPGIDKLADQAAREAATAVRPTP